MKKSSETSEAIREAVSLGAITKEYKADPKHTYQTLNQLRTMEIASYLQYKQHSYMAFSLLSPGLKTEFDAHAEQELQHADTLAERIQQLGGVPIFNFQELATKTDQLGINLEQGTTLSEMVGQDLLLERRQIEQYTATIRTIGDKDPVTRHILIGILQETEKHAGELADILTRTSEVTV